MASIHLDGITVDLTDITDYTKLHRDNAVVSDFEGDNCCIELTIADETIKILAHFNVIMALMNATADYAGFKTISVVDGTNPDEWDEYFDKEGNYHKTANSHN